MPNTGDIFDVKKALATVLRSQGFLDALAAAVEEKEFETGISPTPVPPVQVYTYERLTKLLFPMAELHGYQSVYTENTMVKEGRHRVGVTWTVNEDTEEAATRNVELLARATVDVLWDDSGTESGLLSDYGVNAGPITITEEDYSQLLPSSTTAFMKSVTLVLEVTTWRQ